jgi:hypothetical protein
VRHRRSWVFHLYPKYMRTRYFHEIEALTEELLTDSTFPRRSLYLDLARSVFRARFQQRRTRRWLAAVLCASVIIAAALFVESSSSPQPTRSVALSHQEGISGVPPKQCSEAEVQTDGLGYLCSMTLNPKTGTIESATIVALTPQLASCIHSQAQSSRQSAVPCLPLIPHTSKP